MKTGSLASLFLILISALSSCSGTQKPEAVSHVAGIIDTLHKNDIGLQQPKPGEWLYEHKESGQNLAQYITADPVRPDSLRKTIYLLPLGKFTKDQENVIRYTADYLALYFGVPTRILPPEPDAIIPENKKRNRQDGSVQLLSTYILDLLKKRIPHDAIALMAITEKDLYPKPSWNFVFGQASLQERVGVSSIYRYSAQPIDSVNYPLCLGRLISTSSHEIGHMLSMLHCTYAVCVMNGSNSLEESDSKPNRLCSQCLSKLSWNTGVGIRKRSKSLDSFFMRHRLVRDYDVMHADLELVK